MTNVRAPLAQTNQIRNNGSLRTLTITHREFIRDIYSGTTTPVINQYEVNPGIDEAFPWLSAIAARFETYKFTKLAFHFIPNVGATTNGAIALVPDYDAADDNSAATKQKLLGYDDSVRGPLWKTMTCTCKPRNLKMRTSFYNRIGALKPNLDIKMYDVCSLTTYLDGITSTAPLVVGELWVQYTIVLTTPQLEPVEPDYVIAQVDNVSALAPFAGMTVVEGELDVIPENPNVFQVREAGNWIVSLYGYLTGAPDPLTQFSPLNVLSGAAPGTIISDIIAGVSPTINAYVGQFLLEAAAGTNHTHPAKLQWNGLTDPLATIQDGFLVVQEANTGMVSSYKKILARKNKDKDDDEEKPKLEEFWSILKKHLPPDSLSEVGTTVAKLFSKSSGESHSESGI